MAHLSKWDTTGESFKHGDAVEKCFLISAKKQGWNPAPAPDILQHDHVDFVITTPQGKEMLIEVKGRKKKRRADNEFDDEIIFIEFKNVIGKPGWVYGAAELVAFERENEFIIVNRAALASLAEQLVELKDMRQSPTLYCGYNRRGRRDLVSIILFADIIKYLKKSILTKVK